jgi:adenine-specific DNA methylase
VSRESSARVQLSFGGEQFAAGTSRPNCFRPIHYLGSKLRLADRIVGAIETVAGPCGAIVDLFAGSGTLSLAMGDRREVVSVDIQEYSRVLCSALLRPLSHKLGPSIGEIARRSATYDALRWSIEPLIQHEARCVQEASEGRLDPLCDLVENASLFALAQGRLSASTSAELSRALARSAGRLRKRALQNDAKSLVTRYFGGPYFSFSQAVELDAVLEVAHAAPPTRRDTLLAIVLSTVSDTVNTVGKQFAQPIRPRDGRGQPKGNLLRQVLRDRSRKVFETVSAWTERYRTLPTSRRKHRAVRSDYRDFLTSCRLKVAAVYADPPYTRDHYSRYYHVLETICLRDSPQVSTMRSNGRELLSRGLYRADRHQSPFCIKTQAPTAFRGLFESVRRIGAPLIVSYSPYLADEGARPRLMTVENIVKLAREQFSNVSVSTLEHAHNKFNQQIVNTRVFPDSEVLVICT